MSDCGPLPRSWLFVPADSNRKMMKALSSDADAVIFDLEDSVALTHKPMARELLGLLPERGDGEPGVTVLLYDTVNDDDEGACRAADLRPRAAENGDDKTRNDGCIKTLFRLDP